MTQTERTHTNRVNKKIRYRRNYPIGRKYSMSGYAECLILFFSVLQVSGVNEQQTQIQCVLV